MEDEITTEVQGEELEESQGSVNEDVETSESESEETTKEETDESSEDESESSEEKSGEEGEEKRPRKNGFKRRIDKLRRRETEARQEAEYWRKVALEKSANKSDEAENFTPEESSGGRPNSEEFETHEEFIEALTDWKLDQKLAKHEEQTQRSAQESSKKERVVKFQERMKLFGDATPDFEEVLEDAEDIPVSREMEEAIIDSDLAPELMYELAKDPDLALSIGSMSPVRAVRELGKLEAKILSAKKETKKIQTTSAPAPISTVKRSSKVEKDPNRMSQREYEEWRSAQRKKRSRWG